MEEITHRTAAAIEYEQLLVQLSALNTQGLNDSPEADELRDRMDIPWRGMTNEERQIVRGLSADLYSIFPDPDTLTTSPSSTPTTSEQQAIEAKLLEYYQARDYNNVLYCLRRLPEHDPVRVATTRSLMYQQLGFDWAAAEFQSFAADHCPTDMFLVASAVWTQYSMDRIDNAAHYADLCVDSMQIPSEYRLLAAVVLVLSTQGKRIEEIRDRLQQATNALVRDLQLPAHDTAAYEEIKPSAIEALRIASLRLGASIDRNSAATRTGVKYLSTIQSSSSVTQTLTLPKQYDDLQRTASAIASRIAHEGNSRSSEVFARSA